jgi:hypothetical protein
VRLKSLGLQSTPPCYGKSKITDQKWFENGACDGFNITPTHLPDGCEDFVELVVRELQRRGLFRTEYEGKTLCENLGLKRPVSRYAAVGLDRNLDAAK